MWRRCSKDFRFFAEKFLLIRITSSNGRGQPLVPFFPLSMEQEAVLVWIEFCVAAGIPIRIIIDKCRKLGMSTLIEALLYWLCCFNPEFQALVIAQQAKSTSKILAIAQRFDRKLPPEVHAQIGAKMPHTRTGMIWRESWGSQFDVLTQRSEEEARGADPNGVHVSELGTWHKRRASISDEDAMTALLGSLGDGAFTFCFIESTACGQVGSFYDRFVRAHERWNDERIPMEDKDWRPFFFTWQGVPNYAKDAGPEREAQHAEALARHARGDEHEAMRIASNLGYIDDDNGTLWWERVVEHGLTASQMRWAQGKIEGFKGDTAGFDQEYPLTST